MLGVPMEAAGMAMEAAGMAMETAGMTPGVNLAAGGAVRNRMKRAAGKTASNAMETLTRAAVKLAAGKAAMEAFADFAMDVISAPEAEAQAEGERGSDAGPVIGIGRLAVAV